MTISEFNICVDNLADGLYRFILKNLNDSEKAKDVVQETFTKVWEKVDQVSFEKAKSYFFSAAYRTMIDGIRKDKKSVLMEPEMEYRSTNEGQYSDLNEILHQGLNRLPDVQKSVILLRDYEGYSYDEIAEICKLTASQVKVYIYRARKALQEFIGKMEVVI